jgi:nitrate reductase NapAB chaperone NapD
MSKVENDYLRILDADQASKLKKAKENTNDTKESNFLKGKISKLYDDNERFLSEDASKTSSGSTSELSKNAGKFVDQKLVGGSDEGKKNNNKVSAEEISKTGSAKETVEEIFNFDISKVKDGKKAQGAFNKQMSALERYNQQQIREIMLGDSEGSMYNSPFEDKVANNLVDMAEKFDVSTDENIKGQGKLQENRLMTLLDDSISPDKAKGVMNQLDKQDEIMQDVSVKKFEKQLMDVIDGKSDKFAGQEVSGMQDVENIFLGNAKMVFNNSEQMNEAITTGGFDAKELGQLHEINQDQKAQMLAIHNVTGMVIDNDIANEHIAAEQDSFGMMLDETKGKEGSETRAKLLEFTTDSLNDDYKFWQTVQGDDQNTPDFKISYESDKNTSSSAGKNEDKVSYDSKVNDSNNNSYDKDDSYSSNDNKKDNDYNSKSSSGSASKSFDGSDSADDILAATKEYATGGSSGSYQSEGSSDSKGKVPYRAPGERDEVSYDDTNNDKDYELYESNSSADSGRKTNGYTVDRDAEIPEAHFSDNYEQRFKKWHAVQERNVWLPGSIANNNANDFGKNPNKV